LLAGAPQMHRRMEELRSCPEGSHHGLAQVRACTQQVVEGRRHVVAAVRHGGYRGSRHRKPRCWIRQTACVLNLRGGVGWSGVGGMIVEVVTLLAALRLCEKSAAS